MQKRTLLPIALTAAALALIGCAKPELAAIPTAPAAVAQAAIAPPTVLPAASAPLPITAATQRVALPIQALPSQEAELTPPAGRSLLDIQPDETLQLLADIPIPRTDFGVRMAFSPSSDVLLHNGAGLLIQRFDLVRNQPLPALTGIEVFSPFTISVSPDGSVIVADDGSQMHIWSSGSGEQLNSLLLPPIGARVTAGFHADEFFFAADTSGNVLVWDPHNWGEIGRFSYPGRIASGVLFPDGKKIALQDQTKSEIAILDLQGIRLGRVPIEGDNDRLLSISPAGDRFLLHVGYGYPTEGVRIIEVETGQTVLDLPLLNFRQFAVSSDWSLLAAVGVQNELRLYRLPGGELLLAQPLGVARTLGVSMSPNGAYLAFYVFKGGDQGAAIQVWGRGSSDP